MKTSRRALAMLLACVLAFVVLFSVFYIVREAGHHCCGEDCAICGILSVCENVLQRLLGLGLALVFTQLISAAACLTRERLPAVSPRCTLITLKVKLSS